MPELPDVEIYVEALRSRILGVRLHRVSVYSPFLMRSADPPLEAVFGRSVRDVRRLGKRIAVGFDGDLWIVLHLMIAGRLHWKTAAPKPGSKGLLAAFEFDAGFLTLTEAGSQHR
ncbi:MAG TPA: DNA-formamidopyrimidine glycosylase family protein, partial [Rariglobus sp.]